MLSLVSKKISSSLFSSQGVGYLYQEPQCILLTCVFLVLLFGFQHKRV